MSETGETREPTPAPAASRRRVRRRHRPFLVRYWWILPLGASVVFTPLLWHLLFGSSGKREPLPGYITETAKVEQEYLAFTGKPLDPASAHEFDRSTELMIAGNYGNAAVVLEAASRQIPVPSVFNDLGVLYKQLKDGTQAIRAFRDALARDHDYAAVRANLKTMNMTFNIDPAGSEVEPNNDIQSANVLWIDRPIQGLISPSVGDADCYWFTTPRPPRDRVAIEVKPRSTTLTARLRIFDARGNMITGLQEAPGAGSTVRYEFSPPSNTLFYIEVDGAAGTSGPYSVTVNALRAYDSYEPNDTILVATPMVPGQTIDAGIMDSDDTDFYSVVSPVAATLNINVTSRSASLILGVATFAPDMHNIDFAPDPSGAGAPVHHTLKVEANQTYYIQVFSKNDSFGPYNVVVK